MPSSADQGTLTGSGSPFLDTTAPTNTNLTEWRTIVPSGPPAPRRPRTTPWVIQGQPMAQDASQQQAVVLDAGQLPAAARSSCGTSTFAAVVGGRHGAGPGRDSCPGEQCRRVGRGPARSPSRRNPLRLYGSTARPRPSSAAQATTYSPAEPAPIRCYGGQGGDLIYGNLDADLIYGNQGADTLFGGTG